MSLPTPRLLPSHLHAFSSTNNTTSPAPPTSTIRLLGTISSLRGETATLTCGSHGDVTLILARDSHLQMGRVVEVVGKVVPVDGSGGGLGVRVLGTLDWGKEGDVDYKIYEQVVDATHRFKEIFYESSK
ncbi:hypothetical protein FQN54_006929 [Arachnomyces sp. PD_36]|nr:hypothetical protein FQN54_006929 [Arachnomyces sp. PD_36]